MDINIILSASIPPIVVAIFLYYLKHRHNKGLVVTVPISVPVPSWHRLDSNEVPLWIAHRIYVKYYPNRRRIGVGSTLMQGSYYEYRIRFKQPTTERKASISDIIVDRRVQPWRK